MLPVRAGAASGRLHLPLRLLSRLRLEVERGVREESYRFLMRFFEGRDQTLKKYCGRWKDASLINVVHQSMPREVCKL